MEIFETFSVNSQSLEILCEFWLAKSTGLQDEEESPSFFLAYQTPGTVPTLSHPSL